MVSQLCEKDILSTDADSWVSQKQYDPEKREN